MKSTMEILTKLQENSQKNHDEIFTRLYRYLLRPDIYFIAYQHLYSNKGAGTKGVNDDTADGFSEQYVTAIIEALRTGSYEPKPVRRTYIQKKNGKLRPLGLPVFADKLVQEAIRMILEAIYEPIFSIYSHGFRPGRSCHTALAMIKHEFTGAKWFIEGDIKGCFDNIDHPTLIGVLNRKIKDARFLNLIRMFLKAGYMEDWNFHETYSGCPQGGIISPILANIYLNELDRYITQLKKEFDHGYNPRNFTEEYNTIRHKRDALHEKIKKAEGTMREQLIAQHKQLTKQLFRTPAKACTDKRLKYVRYADDFLIAVNGTREECEEIKAKLTDFVRDTLKMELSQEKTLITHSNTPARFLGFDVRVRRDASVKRSGKRKMRTMNNKVELNIPLKDKVETYLLSHSIAKRDGKRLIPIHRPILLNRTDLEIVMIYNAELRGLCNYYAIASNFNKLVYFGYLMEYSCLKTLANKHRSRIAKVRYEYRDGTGAWGVPYETKKGKRRMMFAKYSDCKGKDLTEKVPDLAYRYSHNTTSFEERLKAKVCEVCGCTDSDSYEIHHVNKVKNLKGKADWEKVMLAKRRKTIVVCHKCHMRIHHEALLFAVQTGISSELTAGEQLRAKLVAHEENACDFVSVTEDTGVRFALDGIRAPWKIYCIRSAYYIYKSYGAALYREMLSILVDAWDGDSDSFLSGILHGMARFLALYQGEYSRERLILRLRTVHPKTITRLAQNDTGNVADRHMKQILSIYNGAGRAHSLPCKR